MHRGVSGVRSGPVEAGGIRYGRSGFPRIARAEYRNLDGKLGAFRATNTDDILADSEPGLAGIWPTSRTSVPPAGGHRSAGLLQSKAFATLCQLRPSWMRGSSTRCWSVPQPVCRRRRQCPDFTGHRIPAIPRNRINGRLDYSITDALKVGGDALFVSDQYFFATSPIRRKGCTSYTVFNAHASYPVNKTFQDLRARRQYFRHR